MWDHETIMMIVQGVGGTLYMTVLSTVLGYLFGLPMGVLLAVSDTSMPLNSSHLTDGSHVHVQS